MVSDIPAGDGKIDILFVQCTLYRLFFTLKDYYDNIAQVISSKYSVDEKTKAKIRISYIYIVHQRGKGHITVTS